MINAQKDSKSKLIWLFINALMMVFGVWFFEWQLADLFFVIFIQTLIKFAFFIAQLKKRIKGDLTFAFLLFAKAFLPFLIFTCYAIETAETEFTYWGFNWYGFSYRLHMLFGPFLVPLIIYGIQEYFEQFRHRKVDEDLMIGEQSYLMQFYHHLAVTACAIAAVAGIGYGIKMSGLGVPHLPLILSVLLSVLLDLYVVKRGSVYNLNKLNFKG